MKKDSFHDKFETCLLNDYGNFFFQFQFQMPQMTLFFHHRNDLIAKDVFIFFFFFENQYKKKNYDYQIQKISLFIVQCLMMMDSPKKKQKII